MPFRSWPEQKNVWLQRQLAVVRVKRERELGCHRLSVTSRFAPVWLVLFLLPEPVLLVGAQPLQPWRPPGSRDHQFQ